MAQLTLLTLCIQSADLKQGSLFKSPRPVYAVQPTPPTHPLHVVSDFIKVTPVVTDALSVLVLRGLHFFVV